MLILADTFHQKERCEEMSSKETAQYALDIRAKMIKSGTRIEGCPIWDELTKDLWTRIVNDELSGVQIAIESDKIMEHCQTCRHPMCIKATFSDKEPIVVGESE
jgi:hypothetical protein